MKKLTWLLTTLVLLLGHAIEANSAPFTFSGDFNFHNDVVKVDFTLANDSSDVKIWTDSYQDLDLNAGTIGKNFDPFLTLWDADTGDLISDNDDYGDFDPEFKQKTGQTIYDSGLFLTDLKKGSYVVTLTTLTNPSKARLLKDLALKLADGFVLDGEKGVKIKDFYVNPNPELSKYEVGSFWQLNIEGADVIPTSAVPLPTAVWMFGSALMGFAGCAKRNAISKTRLSA